MKPLTEKQKKYLWIAAGVLVVIHFAPGILLRARSAFAHPAPTVIQKPSPVYLAPQAPPAPPAPEIAALAKYGGVWAGETVTLDMSRCSLKLEIRLSDELPKKLKGYVSKSCVPLQDIMHRGPITNGVVKNMIDESAPATVIMTGTPAENGITFTTEQAVDVDVSGCSLSALSITEFGQGQVAASWQESKPDIPCPPGKMMLKKRG
jgi:hypothetical protein